MAWNPSPKVAALRTIGKKYNANKVIMILINDNEGRMESISYGKTPIECDMAKALSDIAFDAIYSLLANNQLHPSKKSG